MKGIPLKVRGVVIFKVGDDFVSIANAARRFLDQQRLMPDRVHNVFAGHLCSIVGGLTVEDMIRDREKLTGQTRAACGTEMEKLGLIVDSLQIHEIDDPTGYIKNLAMPHAAAVQRDARIAQAEANLRATEAEQAASARMSEATRATEARGLAAAKATRATAGGPPARPAQTQALRPAASPPRARRGTPRGSRAARTARPSRSVPTARRRHSPAPARPVTIRWGGGRANSCRRSRRW